MPFSFKPDASPVENQSSSKTVGTPTLAPYNTEADDFSSRGTGGDKRSMIDVILMVICAVAVLVSVGLGAYSFYLSSQIEKKKASLESFEARLSGFAAQADDMRRLSSRMKIIDQIFKDHVSVNTAFRLLEESIEHPITYTSFDFRYNDTLKGYVVEIDALAPNYRTVIQQIETYKREPYKNYVSEVKVDGLSPNEKGQIIFSLRMPVKIAGLFPSDLNFSHGAAARAATSSPEAGEESASVSVSTSTPSQ